MTVHLAPTRADVEIDTYALVIHQGGQVLYQYENPIPWEDPQWIKKREYDHGEVPPLNLEQTQVEQQTNDGSLQTVTLYASELDADASHVEKSPDLDSDPHSELDDDADDNSHQGYVIRFSDDTHIPSRADVTHETQQQNMGEAIDYLVTKHDLIAEIELPYSPPRARQNCSVNAKPVHPDGDEMQSPYELTGGYYLHTKLNSQAKQHRIKDLADQIGLSVDFFGDW